jgi:hypothetical protein
MIGRVARAAIALAIAACSSQPIRNSARRPMHRA